MDLSFYTLPEDIQEKILKLAAQFPLTIDEVKELYLMGGDSHTKELCHLKSARCSNNFIRAVNYDLWEKTNKKIWKQLRDKSI